MGEKRNQADFALWKKAMPEHIMHWPSPWSEGFPGWHCECTAMGRKYLGEEFDIHGGGLDLVFPHHECEIAQSVASQGKQMVHYWMHNNMITIDGKKMGKSYNNFITLPQFFAGEHERLERGYSPMTIRFFILQAHYRSTVDFSNEALQSAEKGLARLMEGWKAIKRLAEGQKVKGQPQVEMKTVDELREKCYEAMNDDLASPMVISHLFDACRIINTVTDKKASITAEVAASLAEMSWREFFNDPLLQQLIDSVIARNTNLNSARIAVEKSEASLKAARQAYLPSLNFSPSGTIASFDAGKLSKTYNLPLS